MPSLPPSLDRALPPTYDPSSDRPAPVPAGADTGRVAPESLVVGTLVLVALLLFRLAPELALPGAFNDDGVYLALGRALADGEGYRSVHLVGAPLQVKFPPGLPLLYALLWTIGGSVQATAAIAGALGAIAAAAGAALVWWIGRARLALAPAVLAPACVAPFLLVASIDYYTIPVAEPYFVLGWAAALALAERAAAAGDDGRSGLVLGLVLAATALFRTQAVTLVPAVALGLLLAGHRRAAARCVVAALAPLVAWRLWLLRAGAGIPASSVPDEASYVDWTPQGGPLEIARAVARTAGENAADYASVLAHHLSRPAHVGALVVAAGALLAAFGARTVWREQRALVLSVALALALLLAWPSSQDRLLLPVLPFAGLLAAAGAGRLLRDRGRPVRLIALAAVLAAAGVVLVRQGELRATAWVGATGEGRPRFRMSSYFLPRNSRVVAVAAEWARTGARPADRVLVSLPAGVWLHTGLLTMPGEPTESARSRSVWEIPGDYLVRRIREDGITVVILDDPDRPLARDVRLLWQRCPGAIRYVGGAGAGGFPAIFRVERPADPCLPAAVGSGPRDA